MSEHEARQPHATEEARDAAAAYDESHARLAYGIIQSLLEHTRVVSDLVALMAQVIDRDTTDALTNTPHWNAYLDSRRGMEKTRADIERFAAIWTQLSESAPQGEATADAPREVDPGA